MDDIQDTLGGKNMSDLTIKAIKGIDNTKTFRKEQMKKYRRYGNELIAGSTGIYICEGLALSTIIHCRIATAIGF